MSEAKLEVFVFSYNRGKYLRNCLQSLQRHAPACPVTVVDDGSGDRETRAVLDEYRQSARIVVNDGSAASSLGGLYGNMNWALSVATAEWALFIQDDMQLVRDIASADFDHIDRFFRAYPEAIEFQPCFAKGSTRAVVGDGLAVDENVPVYLRDTTKSNRAYFSAVGIFHVERVRERGITLLDSEAKNETFIAEVAAPIGLSPYPFMMWLPFAESVKFRRKGLLQRYAEWRAKAGLYPFRALTEEEVQQLFRRDLAELPYAEKLLSLESERSDNETWMYAVVRHYRLPRKMLKLQKRLRGETRRKSKGKEST
jgi:glycosyltransferase involved in cell wall biosynthesis